MYCHLSPHQSKQHSLEQPASLFEDANCIHELFQSWARLTPDAPALQFKEQTLSYRELNVRANQLAWRLRELAFAPDTLIALCMERGFEMISTMLAILKAGCAYVPLDPKLPPERLHMLLEHTAAPLLISEQEICARLPAFKAQSLCPRQEATMLARYSTDNPPTENTLENLLYCIFTSGTSGQPKGVLVQGKAVRNLLHDWSERHSLPPTEKFSFWTSIGFDVSVWEWLLPLTHGACLAIASDDERLDPSAFLAWINKLGVSTAYLPPHIARALPHLTKQGLTPPQTVLLGVESLNEKQLHKALIGCKVINGYGPTESTVYATTYCEPLQAIDRSIPLGKPIKNTSVHILDSKLEPVKPGMVGEIYISGAGLARGYLHDPVQTAENFIHNPFGPPGSRMYKTGDLARTLEDGNIEFVGRNDHQVKIRGYRIELEEIERALMAHPDVWEVLVLADTISGEERRLLAYIGGDQSSLNARSLRQWLMQRLPEYMIPAHFILLEKLPLKPNGKVDRTALPPVEENRAGLEFPYLAPQSDTEQWLAQIWAQTLGLSQVGCLDEFSMLGGSSIQAINVSYAIAERLGGRMRVPLPLGNMSLREHARRIVALTDTADQRLAQLDTIPEHTPSYGQQQVWFLEQLGEAWRAYRFHARLNLRGALNHTAMQAALNQLIARHDILRTAIIEHDGQVRRKVAPELQMNLPIVRLIHLAADAAQARLHELEQIELNARYDVSKAPLVRWLLIQLQPEQHVLLISEHHHVHDGQSFRLLLQEFSLLYNAQLSGSFEKLPPKPPAFAEFCREERAWMQSADFQEKLHAWRDHLQDFPVGKLAFSDKRRPSQNPYLGGQLRIPFDGPLRHRATARAAAMGVSLFTLLSSVFGLMCAKHSGDRQFLIGTALANRDAGYFRSTLGMFVNTVPLRFDVSQNMRFGELVRQQAHSVEFALANGQVPVAEITKLFPQTRISNGEAPFNLAFSFHDSMNLQPEFEGLEVKVEEGLSNGSAKFDINVITVLSNHSAGGCNEFVFEFNRSLFDAAFVNLMSTSFLHILGLVCDETSLPINSLLSCNVQERQRSLIEWNNTAQSFEQELCMHQLFERQAALNPDARALRCRDYQLTYAQVNAGANALATKLMQQGLEPGQCVAICLSRTSAMAVALMAVLKCGAAYVPLDPRHPTARLAYIIEDSAATLVLTEASLRATAAELPLPRMELWLPQLISEGNQQNPHISGMRSTDLAYLIYTSGSTGMPKGVAVQHRPVINLIEWVNKEFNVTSSDTLLFTTSLCFDLSVYDIFGALAAGACVRIAADEEVSDAEVLSNILCREDISFWNSAPAVFSQMLPFIADSARNGNPHHLRLAFFSGDWIALDMPDKLRAVFPACQVVSLGGATEATVWSNFFRVAEIDPNWASIPYGKPISNARYYILDQDLQPCPVGVAGDLYIGGECLSIGYWKRPELSARAFIADPFSDRAHARMYFTGDRARFGADGVIEFLGRRDGQIKIRGFRVELGEIECALKRCQGVQDAVVLARTDHAGQTQLSAYLVSNIEPAECITKCRQLLSEALPSYMMPAHFVMIEQIPVTVNGKVDRAALPDPQSAATQQVAYEAAQSALEQAVAQIWAEMLGISRIGRQDHFFSCGGHSLLATQVIARLRKQLSLQVRLRTLFSYPVLQDFCQALSQLDSQSCLVPIRSQGSSAPLFVIHPVGGEIGYAQNLSKHLDRNIPVYALAASGLAQGEAILDQVEQMASRYLALIRSVQADGPYHLCGWSAGGIIAYEIAKQLTDVGEQVAFLGMIDTRADYYRYADMPNAQIPDEERQALEMLDNVSRQRHLEVRAGIIKAITQYHPSTLELSPFLFVAAREHRDDPSLGWRALLGDQLCLKQLDANHYSIVEEPAVLDLSRQIKYCLLQFDQQLKA